MTSLRVTIFIALTGVFMPPSAFSAVDKCSQLADRAVFEFRQGNFDESRKAALTVIDGCSELADQQQADAADKFSSGLPLIIYPQKKLSPDLSGLPVTLSAGIMNSVGWDALNAVGAAYFVLAEIAQREENIPQAQKMYQTVIQKYPNAYQKAYQGWFWKISELARDRQNFMRTAYDFEDYQPATFIRKSWELLYKKEPVGAAVYAEKCLRLYELSYSSDGESRDETAVAHFILGQIALMTKGETDEAFEHFRKILTGDQEVLYPKTLNYPFYNNITAMAKDYIALKNTSYDFGNYTSETLTRKAWKSWDRRDFRGVELYAKKCIDLWGAKARLMQRQMKDFARGSFVPYFWAVNDVGTCYFILGMAYEQQGKITQAREIYETVINDLGYAQCWDPRGHYWKVAAVSKKKIAALDDQ